VATSSNLRVEADYQGVRPNVAAPWNAREARGARVTAGPPAMTWRLPSCRSPPWWRPGPDRPGGTKAVFNLFKSLSPPLDLTPRNCLVVSLIYCMGADGEVDEEEVGHLASVLGRDATREQLDAALRYVRATRPEQFLADAAPRLRPEQRLSASC
jgi:hypothetical protein